MYLKINHSECSKKGLEGLTCWEGSHERHQASWTVCGLWVSCLQFARIYFSIKMGLIVVVLLFESCLFGLKKWIQGSRTPWNMQGELNKYRQIDNLLCIPGSSSVDSTHCRPKIFLKTEHVCIYLYCHYFLNDTTQLLFRKHRPSDRY